MALTPEPIKQDRCTLIRTELGSSTDNQMLASASATDGKLLALDGIVEGAGTVDLEVYHGDATDDTLIATYYAASPTEGVITDLFPNLAAAGGIDISNGLFISKGSDCANDNIVVRALYRLERDG